MLDTVPEAVHHKIIDSFGSPRSRQNWTQVSHEAHRLTRQSDPTFYENWLRDDFSSESPVETEVPAKEIYRAHLVASRRETSRLLHLARNDDVRRFTADIADPEVQQRLSGRYGKRPLAHAGLRMTQRLAQPRSASESPPRLREGDLAGLESATLVMHTLAGTEEEKVGEFCDNLRSAARQAEQQVTMQTQPGNGPPPPPRRKRRAGY